ncbi:hypothetical protein O9992_04990 [Vibrio lentus]|nr:hypothetical protein [Vibrio lentus]
MNDKKSPEREFWGWWLEFWISRKKDFRRSTTYG